MPGLIEDHCMHVVLLVLTSCISVNAGIKYDAEKEERQLQEARQRELQRIEETKQKAAEKGAVNHLSLLWLYIETCSAVCEFAFGFLYSENPKAEKQDTFVEKLVTQVIKNLQVKISNIHVRYEDDVSTFDMRFAFSAILRLGAFMYLNL